MKKLIAIILSAALLFTSIISASMFTVSADGEVTQTLTDTVIMPKYLDKDGNEINVVPTMEKTPSSVISGENSEVVKNTSKLPLSALFKYSLSEAAHVNLSVEGGKGKGILLYVEMPESANGNDVRLSTQFLITDGQTGRTGANRYVATAAYWYYLEKGSDSWTHGNEQIKSYGLNLPSEFKGYVYIPINTIVVGATDLPETEENEARPQERDSNGNKLYKDAAGNRVTDAVDAETGLENTPIYAYAPSENNVHYANAGIDAEDTITGLVLMAGSNYSVTNGNMTAEDTITISAPIIVKGEESDGAAPDATSVIIDGTEYDLYKGKAVTYPDASNLDGVMQSEFSSVGVYTKTTTTARGNVADAKPSGGTRTAIASISPLTDAPSVLAENFKHAADGATYSSAEKFYEGSYYNSQTAVFEFAENTTLPDAGFLVYAELPSVAGEHRLASKHFKYDGTYTSASNPQLMQIASGTVSWYILPEGATEWQVKTATGDTTGLGYSIGFGDYDAEKGSSPAFKGWIYIPKEVYRVKTTTTPIEMLSLMAATYTGNAAKAVDIKFSAMTGLKAFDPTTTVVVGDNNKVVDIATGKIFDIDYDRTADFNGNKELVNNGNLEDVLAMEYLPATANDKTWVGQVNATANTYTTVSSGNLWNGKLIESVSPVNKFPMMKMTCHTAGKEKAYFNWMSTGIAYARDYEGLVVYIKNNTSSVKRYNFATYGRWVTQIDNGDGTFTDKTNSGFKAVSGNADVLFEGDTSWRMNYSSVVDIPANTGAYIHISMADVPDVQNYLDAETTAIYNFVVLTQNGSYTTYEVGDEVIVGLPHFVTNWSENVKDMAFVNGSEVAQNMFTGEFVAPNDHNGDLAVNLIDLVQAKEEASETDFTTFRANYLNTYFNDAEYSVLSAAFSVAPLNYNPSDASTILNENPDRGYRSELFAFFAESPLTIEETPNYSVTLKVPAWSLGSYTIYDEKTYEIAVSGNTIRGSEGVIDEANVDTDYNINHNDMTPLGVGSGGSIHTVPVAAAEAYAKANKLSYDTEAQLISAAIKLVNDYMYYDYRPYNYENPTDDKAGISNIDIVELKKPVYAHEEGYDEMEGSAYGSNYGSYKWAKTHTYDTNGKISEIKLLVAHGRRTLFATDTEAEWRLRWTYMFDGVYRIGANRELSFTDNYGNVTKGNKVTNNLFNAYLQFTDFAHKDAIPEGVLRALDYFFDFCRERGVKSCFRPSYNTYTQNAYLDQSKDEYVQFRNNVASQCADEDTMIAHIKQMAPVIAENKDVIHKISSGWIGFGGEMAAGYQYPPVSYKNVITALLDYHCIPNGLYFSSRSSAYYTKIINGIEGDANYNNGLGYGDLDILNGLEADAEWGEKYAKWCGFNDDAFFGAQNFSNWGSGADNYQPGMDEWETDNAIAYVAPNDGEFYTNENHVYNITIDSDGVYHWIGDGTAATDNKIPTPMEAILELAHHRYTDFSQWHGYLEKINDTATTTVMELWQDHDAEWVFEGTVDSVANGSPFNAEERAAEITAPLTKEMLEANGILYDPAWFNGNDTRNAYEFIRDHLGYRIVAEDVSVDYDGRKSDKVNVSVNLRNYGFAAAFNMESTLAILDADGNLVQEIKTGDPSTWYNLAPDYYTVERNSSAQGDVLTHTLSAEFDALTKSGTYYVAVKLSNTMHQSARFSNDIEINEQGYNILGSFYFVML